MTKTFCLFSKRSWMAIQTVIPALLRENAEHYEELMANPFRHLEWSYVEWLYNQILTALSPGYVQNYAESAGSLDLSFDPDHPETEAASPALRTERSPFYDPL